MHKSLDLGRRNMRYKNNENRHWRFAVGVIVREIQTKCPTLELIVRARLGLSMKSLAQCGGCSAPLRCLTRSRTYRSRSRALFINDASGSLNSVQPQHGAVPGGSINIPRCVGASEPLTYNICSYIYSLLVKLLHELLNDQIFIAIDT